MITLVQFPSQSFSYQEKESPFPSPVPSLLVSLSVFLVSVCSLLLADGILPFSIVVVAFIVVMIIATASLVTKERFALIFSFS